jgi:hypothetical protein
MDIPGYIFYPHKLISSIHNFGNKVPGNKFDIKDVCDKQDDCKAFGTDGYRKLISMPNNECISKDPTESNCWQPNGLYGTYSKFVEYPDILGFKKFPNKLIGSPHNIATINMHNQPLNNIATECLRRPECRGFDINGNLKLSNMPTKKCPDKTSETYAKYCYIEKPYFATYIKSENLTIPEYKYIKNKNIPTTNNVHNLNYFFKSYYDIANECNANPSCKSFSLDGYLKNVGLSNLSHQCNNNNKNNNNNDKNCWLPIDNQKNNIGLINGFYEKQNYNYDYDNSKNENENENGNENGNESDIGYYISVFLISGLIVGIFILIKMRSK